ncbi:RHS repeat-associated core domain-containing protein [Chitinophaga eiseniae]|uniref:RHS repeat-associated core domain-containing protein n=1 Tax=Chitinophaga eiseniae TaxID=634771 RepID=A0A847SDB6_9BACT|nr:RHS repeat-associated core domain-containing protein [Chitinophaga eiseniae]NLR81200.1 hypothetical protein [Chitinophaga eiseniae]
MRPYLLKISRTLLLLLSSILLLGLAGYAQQGRGVLIKRTLDGAKGQLAKDSAINVQDDIYFDAAIKSRLDTPYLVRNSVTLRINEYAGIYLPDTFSATVNVRIFYTAPDLSTYSTDRSLTINYDTAHPYSLRNSFVFSNAHQVKVQVLSVATNASRNVIPALVLDNEMEVHPVYKLDCQANAITTITSNQPANTDSTDEITVSWPAVAGADVYDLEWAYIDSSALEANRYGSPVVPALVFQNNTTRVTISGNSYAIPLLYDKVGVLFFRVRAVQEKNNDVRIETAWSSNFPGGMGSYTFDGHQHQLNWQSSISFAEDGKRKVVLQYYDGSLRNRQTVTKDNTTNQTVVAESLYDYQGRPVIQVLPAPTLNQVMKYTRNLNGAINGGEYDKNQYDRINQPSDILTASAPAMSTGSGANQYYSPANPEKNTGINQYLPDAQGYAFTETIYTPDNTGRVSRQGGVGAAFKIGSNHETKYYYGDAEQENLDALFGTEAGLSSHYSKNAVEDANGQVSVSYIDMHGRTVATALAGEAWNKSLTDLPDKVVKTETDSLSGAGSTAKEDQALITHRSIPVLMDGTYTFTYEMDPPTLKKVGCNNDTTSYLGLYDLQVHITDDAWNLHLGGAPFDTVLHNYTPDLQVNSDGKLSLSFSLYLVKGTYEVTKTLSISQVAMDYYRDSIFLKHNVCTTLEEIREAQLAEKRKLLCAPACAGCEDSLHTDGDDIRAMMLEDMSPPSGQYALLADSSNSSAIAYSILFSNNGAPVYKRSDINYLNADGSPSMILNAVTNTMVKPQELPPLEFADAFQPSWAEVLLKYHPEFCKLSFLSGDQLKKAQLWEKDFLATDTYSGAKQKGYLAPLSGSTADPLTALMPDYLNTEMNKFKSASNQPMTLLGMAIVSTICDQTASCSNTYGAYTPTQAESSFCGPDQDMIWRTFRSLYLNIHRSGVDNYINSNCPGGSQQASALMAIGKAPRFVVASNVLQQTGADAINNSIQQSSNQTQAAQDAMNQVYYQQIDTLADRWLKQLAPCKYDAGALGEIKMKLLALCKASADNNHPYGASTLKPGASNPYTSFQAILAEYNDRHQITDPLICNGEMITFPAPYDKQPATANNFSFKKPQECECNNLNALNAEYQQLKLPADANFSAYLLRKRGVKIAQTDLDDLLAACGSNTANCNYLPKPVKIPTLIQCNIAAPCVNCAVTDSLYSAFVTAYPGVTPAYDETDSIQRKKNVLFAAFMNGRLGFHENAGTYLEFRDSCHQSTNRGTPVCIKVAGTGKMVNTYSNGGQDSITDVRAVAGGFILAGSTTGCSAGGKDAYIIKTDLQGNLQWSKTYGGTEDDVFRRLIPTADSGYIGIGTTYSFCFPQGAMLVVKTAADGTMVWNKTIDFGDTNGAIGSDIVETSTGNFAIAGLRTTAGVSTEWITGVLTPEGDLLWLKQTGGNSSGGMLRMASSSSSDTTIAPKDMISLVASNDTLIAATTMNGQNSEQAPVLFKQNLATGTELFMMQYQPTGMGNCVVNNLLKTATGYKMVVAGSNVAGELLDVDNTGLSVTGKQLKNLSGSQSWTAITTADGGVMSAASTQDVYWSKWGADNSLQTTSHVQLPGNDKVYKIAEASDGRLAGAGLYNGQAMLMLANKDGKSGCSDKSESLAAQTDNPSLIALATQATLYLSDRNINTVAVVESNCQPTANTISCLGIDSCFMIYTGLLCGNAMPVYDEDPLTPVTSCADSLAMADNIANIIYNAIVDSVANDFNNSYINTALDARERFAVTHSSAEYHYTLYYYDQAGNLVKTIPPAGVVKDRSDDWLRRVKAAREQGVALTVQHRLPTEYRYNTLNGMVEQKTPDAGVSRYWYDRLGRVAVSQNAQQVTNAAYSYTLYDNLGRITEVGEIHSSASMSDAISRDPVALSAWIQAAGSSRAQITRTIYDQPYGFIEGIDWKATNLRNRVAWSAVYNKVADTIPGGQASATYYSYDIHGNVRTLLQDYNPGTEVNASNRFKKINYSYDLVSGKVNTVSYQPGKADAFYHRYSYDAENRLTNVETSRDSLYWENDAYYQYYKHGPLARSVIGQAQVQGIDYAYTLQGWLKGINSSAIGTGKDIGLDGATNGITAKDVFGFGLHYFGDSDYVSVSGKHPFAGAAGVLKPLYNGNIGAMSVNLPKAGEPLLYAYKYDALNRLVGMEANRGLEQTTNTWTPLAINDYKEDITYDANGNIQTYHRNGNKPSPMDQLTYHYQPGTNKLSWINDSISAGQYDTDIDDQLAGNYQYDSIGNLISDKGANLDSVVWTVYGKIARIRKADGTLITYTYDAAGNRISKQVGNTITRYVRDATGNVMSIYVSGDPAINNGQLSQTETPVYGSSRLGVDTRITAVQQDTFPEVYKLTGVGDAQFTNFMRRYKVFELSNHLGNVLATVSDDKLGVSLDSSLVDHYEARVISAQDYAPFGMGLLGRSMNSGGYRWGFNGKENDNEVKGEGNQQDYGMRVYDPRIGKFLSVDPLTRSFPYYSPYQFAGNKPIWATDLDGAEEKYFNVDLVLTNFGLLKAVTTKEVENPYARFRGLHETFEGVRWNDGFGPKGKGIEFSYRVFRLQSDGSKVLIDSRVDFVPQKTFFEKISSYFAPTREGDKAGGIPFISSRRQPGSNSSFNAYSLNPDKPVNIDVLMDVISISITASGQSLIQTPKNPVDLAEFIRSMSYVNGAQGNLKDAVNATIPEKKKENKPDSATCPKCSDRGDSAHIDQVNGSGTFGKLREAGQTDQTKEKKKEK